MHAKVLPTVYYLDSLPVKLNDVCTAEVQCTVYSLDYQVLNKTMHAEVLEVLSTVWAACQSTEELYAEVSDKFYYLDYPSCHLKLCVPRSMVLSITWPVCSLNRIMHEEIQGYLDRLAVKSNNACRGPRYCLLSGLPTS